MRKFYNFIKNLRFLCNILLYLHFFCYILAFFIINCNSLCKIFLCNFFIHAKNFIVWVNKKETKVSLAKGVLIVLPSKRILQFLHSVARNMKFLKQFYLVKLHIHRSIAPKHLHNNAAFLVFCIYARNCSNKAF